MGTRFSKRIKLFPGIYINLGKSGISTSVGVRGASVTVGHDKTRTNIGIPGTGINHSTSEPTTSVPIEPSAGISFGRLLRYGLIGLFLTIFLLGFFRVI